MSTLTHFPSGRVPEDTLAARLVLIRHELGIQRGKRVSQRDAAEETGVPYGTWQGMESGRATRELDQHVRKIAETYGYDPVWLMWGTRVGPRPDGPDGGQRQGGNTHGRSGALARLTEAKRARHAEESDTRRYPVAA